MTVAHTKKNALDDGKVDEGKSTNPTPNKTQEKKDMTSLQTPTDNPNTPPLDTPEQISAEICWVAAEANALSGRYDEPERRDTLDRRKGRLLRAIYSGDDCPSWCTEHSVDDPPVMPEDDKLTHQARVVVGEIEVEISKGEDNPDGTVVWVPQYDWVNGQELDDMIEALQLARALVAKEG